MTKLNFIVISILIFFINCGKKTIYNDPPKIFKPQKLIWYSSPERPEWIVSEPEKEGDKFCFVGLSEYCSTEKNAREDAMRAASNAVAGYVNTSVIDIYRELSVRYGKSSDISDPEVSSKELQEYIKNSVISRIKASKWYIEQWLNIENEGYWKVYLLVTVPEQAIKDAISIGTKKYEEILSFENKKEEAELEKQKQKREFWQGIFKKAADKVLEKIDKKK